MNLNLFKTKTADFEAKIASLTADNERLSADYLSLLADFDAVKDDGAALATANARITELEAENANLSASAESAATIGASLAIDTLASIGSVPVEEVEEKPTLSLLDQMKTLKGAELVAFYNKNKSQLYKN